MEANQQPVQVQRLIDKVGNELFRYINSPLNFILGCKLFYLLSLDSHSRAKWVIYKYGRAQALFHAVRLGPNFINVQVVKVILANGGILSRYFVQRLLMHFGRYDKKLIELKIAHNVGQIDPDRIRNFKEKIKSPWASNLPISVFTYLITEASNQLNIKELAPKGNDMELFHFLSAGPHVISEAPAILSKNKVQIEELIREMKFIPFPPRPKPKRSDTHHLSTNVPEEYPPKDGYENSRQLNVIARAILICKDLVVLWKEIGYYQICSDVNDLVMQGALLILFPPTPSCGYVRPDVNRVNERLEELIELGFDLTYNVIGDIMQLFENRLSDVGGIFLESFVKIKGITVKELLEKILIESIKPERNLKKFELWNFLNIHLEKIYDEDFNEEAKKLRSKIEYQEDAFMKAMTEYMEHTSESNITNNPDNEDDTEDAPKKFITSLKLLPKFYSWILKIFGANAEITKVCFDDILKTRVSINEQLIQDLNSELPPNGWTKCSYEATVNIWKIFCNSGVPFKYNHMQYLSHATHEEVLGPLFKGFLPKLFKMESTTTYYLSVEDPNNQEANDQNAEGQHEETSVNITLPIDCNYTTSKSDHKILESDDQNDELIMWFEVLSNLNDHLMISNDGKLATNEFKQYLRAFMDKIDVSQFKNNKRRPFDLSDHQSKKKQRNNILISNSK